MKLMNPLVTISIPIYKCADFLEACLDSVRLQTYSTIEVILINDQTPDNSVQIAEDFIKKHQLEDWRIIHLAKNSGLSVVRNKGIDTALGKYVFFIDSDDTITYDCISTLVEIAEKTGAEMTISQLECHQLQTGVKSLCIKINSNERFIEGNKNIFKAFANSELVTYGVNKLLLVNFIKENEIYFVPDIFAEDELWSFMMYMRLTKIGINKKVTYTYFLHQKSIIHNRSKKTFDDWLTIAKYVNNAFKEEKDLEKKKLILSYFTHYKNLTLTMNWKAQKSPVHWKESYSEYKKLSSLRFVDYLSPDFTISVKKEDFFNTLPTALGFQFFQWRYNR